VFIFSILLEIFFTCTQHSGPIAQKRAMYSAVQFPFWLNIFKIHMDQIIPISKFKYVDYSASTCTSTHETKQILF